MVAFIIIHLLLPIYSVVPIWDLKKSSIDLLKNGNSYNYRITYRFMYQITALLVKSINKTNEGKIKHENILYINGQFKAIVQFENIDSFFGAYREGVVLNFLCPMGKYHVINLDDMNEINNEFLESDNNWDLKCYYHSTGFFFVFYLSNGEDQVYALEASSYHNLKNLDIHRKMYDFKLANVGESIHGNYPMCSLVDWGGYIQFVGTEYILRSGDNNPERSTDKNKTLIKEKKYSQAVFENSTNHFYYFTYNNISDFSSGFSNKTASGWNCYINNVEVNNNYTSPFEFVDQVEIKEMKFLYYSKYVYYSIYSNKTLKEYHGVLDITLNKIIILLFHIQVTQC